MKHENKDIETHAFRLIGGINMKLRRIDVLLDEETGEKFDIDDIVKIEVYGYQLNRIQHIGRIQWINTLELQLDRSKEYQKDEAVLKYDNIASIEKYR
jgi:hypothetical protein